MADIIVAFNFKNKNYLYFINDNYIGLISFLLTLTLLKIIKIRQDRKKNLKKITNIPPGGNDIDSCLEPNDVSKVLEENLNNALKSMLRINDPGRYFISPSVLFTAYSLIKTEMIKQKLLTIGIRFLITDAQSALKKTVTGINTGLAIAAGVGILNLPGLYIGGGSIAVFSLFAYFYLKVPCKDQLAPLPSMMAPGGQIVRYLPELNHLNPRAIEFYVVGDRNMKIPVHKFVASDSDEQVCDVNEGPNANSFTQTCNTVKTTRKIEPEVLRMDDLKRLDSTEVRTTARPLYDRHFRKRERFKAKRLAIMENRNKNHALIESEAPTPTPKKNKVWEDVGKNFV